MRPKNCQPCVYLVPLVDYKTIILPPCFLSPSLLPFLPCSLSPPPLCQSQEHKALAPRFPKPKDEGWFLILGEVDSGELLAMKRIGFIRGRTTASLAFTAPAQPGRHIYTLYLISDCYISLDQQYDVPVDVE